MSDQQFTAFCVVLASISLPSISLLFVFAWDLWQYGTSKAAMSNNQIKQRLFCVWVAIALLLLVSNIHTLSCSLLTERVDALEQSQTSNTQR